MPGLILKYGNYTHQPAECELSTDAEAIYSQGGIIVGQVIRWDIQGFLHADTKAQLTSALADLEAAYSIQGQDAIFYLDDSSTPTHHALRSSNTVDGVRVVRPPHFPEGKGAEYTTFRRYSIGLEATYHTNFSTNILAFYESVSFRGGGPRDDFLLTLEGLPQEQRLNQYTVFEATQEGSAIGQLLYPNPPDPLWPANLSNKWAPPTKKTPKRYGPPGQPRYREWEISWNYQFKSAVPLLGDPNLYPG